jgi:hypothetical protein
LNASNTISAKFIFRLLSRTRCITCAITSIWSGERLRLV